MDEPYQPPAAEPLEPQDEKPVANKVARSARILAIGALVVGGALLLSFGRLENIFADLLGDSNGLARPRMISEALVSCYKGVVGSGMAMAAFAMSAVSFKRARLALVLGLLAILIIGGWAAMVLYELMSLVPGMAR